MKTNDIKKSIRKRALDSGVIIRNYSKIRIVNHTAKLGNPWTMEHDYIFRYNGCLYEQTAKVTGMFSAVCKYTTRPI